MRNTTKKALVGIALFTTATLGVGAGVASAGEVTGTGKLLPVNGRSVCAFSGLNDAPVPGDPFEGRTQSFGSIIKITGPLGGIPGTACNPTKAP
jgi:hypothetical protein